MLYTKDGKTIFESAYLAVARALPVQSVHTMLQYGWYQVVDNYPGFDLYIQRIDAQPLVFDEDRQIYVRNFTVSALGAVEQARMLEALRHTVIDTIDDATSDKILAGFDYNINGVQYHIPYDLYDQQNFADTDNARLPSVQWKVLRDGVAESITLTNAEFHDLYVNGAIQFKLACLAEGRQLKQQAEAAADVQTLKDLLAGLEG